MLTPRWYQAESVEATWNYLCQTRECNPLIELPTGAGKSLVIAMLVKRAIAHDGRVIVLAHRKELLEQNGQKIIAQLNGDSKCVGFYSAGLNKRNTSKRVIIGGIQSVAKRAFEFGQRNLIIVDEAHLIPESGEGSYRTFLGALASANRNLRVVGLTATPYRTGVGKVAGPDRIFSEIVYRARVRRLIDDGYLCNLISSNNSIVDTQSMRVRAGEFVSRDMEDAYLAGSNVEVACKKIIKETQQRNHVLIFCSGVNHAEAVTDLLIKQQGEESVRLITGQTPKLMRSGTLDAFKSGGFKYLVNVDVLTTGFDAPNIDCIAVLRSTMSPGLFAQMVGRGLRVSPGKQDCLILDFGENIKNHGAIDAENYGAVSPSRGSGGGGRDGEPVKNCPSCDRPTPIRAMRCEACNFEFPPNHDAHPDGTAKILSEPEDVYVEEISFARHKGKPGKQDTLRVDYFSPDNYRPYSEWICLEHEGFARGKAVEWWQQHSIAPYPDGIDDAIDMWKRGALRTPTRLTVQNDGKWDKITNRHFEEEHPREWNEKDLSDLFEDEEIPF